MNTPVVTQLLETLAAELERPRTLTAQVTNHLTGTFGVPRDHLTTFLVAEMPALEDYEVDLILAPLFTPTLRDQAIFAELLGQTAVPPEQWPALIQKLVACPIRAQFVSSDGQACSLPLRAVTIERYVHRLRLDATIPDSLFKLVDQWLPAADRPMLKAVARRAVWLSEPRRQILARFLACTANGSDHRVEDAVELLRLVETYQPADLREFLGQIPHWQQVLRQQINADANPKPFFNERVQELHGGGRDQRQQDLSRLANRENELNFLGRLLAMLTV